MNNTSARNDQRSANIIALAANGVGPTMTVSKGGISIFYLYLLSVYESSSLLQPTSTSAIVCIPRNLATR